MKDEELVGQKIGNLLIIEYLGSLPWKRKNGRVDNFKQYKCICDCGVVCNKRKQDLALKNVKSCGCLMKKYFNYLKTRENPNKLPENHAAVNRMYDRYKLGAERRGHDFLLTREDIEELVFQKCYYCGKEPYLKQSRKQINGNPCMNGIDRVDNSLGYTKENCVTCCKQCNYAKHEMSQEEFLDLIKMIYNNLLR